MIYCGSYDRNIPVDTIFPDVAESRPAGQIEVPAGWIVNFAHRKKNVGGIGICHGSLWAEYCRDAAGLARDRNHPVGLERAREIYALSWYSTLGNSQFSFRLINVCHFQRRREVFFGMRIATSPNGDESC